MLNKRLVKLALVFLFIVLCFIGSLTSKHLITTEANSGTLQGGATGAPGELTCATIGCHSGSLNQGQGNLQLSITNLDDSPINGYVPGTEYKVKVVESNPNPIFQRWGFQLTVIRDSDIGGAGQLLTTDNLTQIMTNGPVPGRQYVEQQGSNEATFRNQSLATWTFHWLPDMNVGSVTFYVAGAQCNNDGGSNGDEIYTKKFTLNTSGMGADPAILSAERQGKNLVVTGMNFSDGAKILLNGEQRKTIFVDSTTLIGKKLGKVVQPGDKIQVRVSSGAMSNEITFGGGCSSITCPANQTATAPPEQNTVVVNYPSPVTTGSCTVSCTPPSGSQFPLGTMTVNCTEPSGNACSFTITVNQGCAITCPGKQTATATSADGAVVNYPAPTTIGNCGAVTCMPPPGAQFPLGPTTVNCSTPEGSSCSFVVKVNPQ